MNKEDHESEYTIYEYFPKDAHTGEDLKFENIIIGDEYILDPEESFALNLPIKWWESRPTFLKSLSIIETTLKRIALENTMLLFDGPDNSIKESHPEDPTYKIVKGKLQHIRRTAYSLCGLPKKIFQIILNTPCPDDIDPITFSFISRYRPFTIVQKQIVCRCSNPAAIDPIIVIWANTY